MEIQQNAVNVFISYDRDDETLLQELEKHLSVLKQQGLISTWHHRQIVPGTNRAEIIEQQLKQASILLLLVSAGFLASDYYQIEVKRALEGQKAGKARLIPIITRACDWKKSPLAHLAVLPDTEKPLAEWHNRDAAFSNIVAGIRRVVEELTQSSQQESPPSQSQVWNVPYHRNPYFTGRDDLLDRLEQQLAPATQNAPIATRSAALTQPHAIKGLGGIGKTQVAVEYAYRACEQGRYTHTFWINSANEEALIASFTALAELLPAFPVKGEIDQRKLVEAVRRWLEQCQEHWLLIFDNADDIALLRDYLPQRGSGSILLTTRAHAVGSLATSIEVDTMGWLEGTHLLLRRAQLFEHASDEEINQAGNIVVALDHFPLALDQAGAYIEETGCGFVGYLQVYHTHRKELLARRGGPETINYPDSVMTTWSLSFQKVEQANPAAAELLRLCAFLAPDTIPEELITNGAPYWSSPLQQTAADLFLFNQMVEELLKFSLIQRLAETQILRIHRLVQAVQMDTMEPEVQYQWAERVVRAVNEVFPNPSLGMATWPQCLRYLDQAQVCDTLIAQYMLPLVEAADLLNRTGFYLKEHVLYTIAEPLYRRALMIREQQLGPTHPRTAESLSNLAQLYRAQGKYTKGERLAKQALEIYEQQMGPEHPNIATTLSNLALLYIDQGQYEQAEPLLKRALAICEQLLGPKHPDTARNLNNLAALYDDQGKYAIAEPLHLRALAIREQQLGDEHPHTAQSLNNLASLYKAQRKDEQAELLWERALAISERQLGSEHRDTVLCLSNLALLYMDQGKYEQAEPLLKRTLTIYEQQLGGEHSDTATSLNNLATLYSNQGEYEQAEPLYQRVLEIRKQQLGADHPDTATSLNNLAKLYDDQGKYDEAELLYWQALSIYEQQLGPEHPSTAICLNNLAEHYYLQGKYGQAEPLYQRALAIREQQLGSADPATALSLNNLARLYQAWDKFEQAEPLFVRALTIREQVLGLEYSDTVMSLVSLAQLYRAQGKYEQIVALYQRFLTISDQRLGSHHDLTKAIRGAYDEARKLGEGS